VRDGVGERADDLEQLEPCVMISGIAFWWGDLTWMKWMSTPSISVVNCGSAFSCASHLRQSYSVAQ
jgi:hypothetical protein